MKEVCIQANKLFGNSRDGIWKGYQLRPILSDRSNIVENYDEKGNDNNDDDDENNDVN